MAGPKYHLLTPFRDIVGGYAFLMNVQVGRFRVWARVALPCKF